MWCVCENLLQLELLRINIATCHFDLICPLSHVPSPRDAHTSDTHTLPASCSLPRSLINLHFIKQNMATPTNDSAAMKPPSPESELIVDISESPTFATVPWPVRPRPGINYNFVAGMYLGGCALALFFYVLEKQLLAPLLVDENGDDGDGSNATTSNDDANIEKDDDSWKEFAKGMEGMYFIFVPFVPCLLWSLVVRYYWMGGMTSVSQGKKNN